jgi:hypothetical protein
MNSSVATRLLVLLTAALLPTAALAANWLSGVDEISVNEDVSHVIISLGVAVALKSDFSANEQDSFTAKASIDMAEPTTDFQFVELDFSQEQQLVQRVSIEGSKSKGATITVQIADGYTIDTKPQLRKNQLRLTFIRKNYLRRVASGTSAPAAFAVEFVPPQTLSSRSLPREIAKSYVVYTRPGAPSSKRIGFFKTQTAAEVVLRQIRGRYPTARVVPAGLQEQDYAQLVRLFPAPELPTREAPSEQVQMAARAVTPDTIVEEESTVSKKVEFADELDRSELDAAQEAYISKDWPRAIALYTKAAESPPLREEALEKLGVVRERNQQHAHAKVVYENFLLEYPDSTGAARVRQRLQSLLGATESPATLRNPKKQRPVNWTANAFASQFYARQSIEVDGAKDRVPLDAVFTDITAIARRHSKSGFHEARISAGHILDFANDDKQRTVRVQRAYWESFFERYQAGFRVGRQSRNKSGVLGRFDGATVSYKQNSSLQWNVVGGYIVRSTYDKTESNQPFVGVSADIEMLEGKLEISPFAIQQYYDGILDRRAVGTHLFWVTEDSVLSALVDYDVHHAALNNFYLNASYNLNQNWRIHGAFDQRRSPYLTTSNALIGQRLDDLSELELVLIDMKLGDLAEDRTATSTTVRTGIDGALSDTWHLSLDASASDYSSTNTSAGVIGIPNRKDYYFTTQLRANNLIGKNSYNAVQMRYQTSDYASTSTIFINNRFTLFDDWSILPRVMASQRTYDATSQQQIRIRPSLRIDYSGFQRFTFQAELGYDWNSRETTRADIEFTGLFLSLGYRARF